MEHLILIFHIFSFVFLIMLISFIPDLIIGSEFLIISPIYFYLALRRFYEQSHLLTIIKFVILNVIFFISANLAAALFFIATAAVY